MVNNTIDKARFIKDYTGFDIQDCLTVLEASELYDLNKLLAGESIKYGKLFMLEPRKVKGRKRYDINNKKVAYVPSHYALRARPLIHAQEALKRLAEEE